MKHIRKILIPIIIFLFMMVFGCNLKPTDIGKHENPDMEACLAALWITSELEVPMELAWTIHDDLKSIRDSMGDRMPIVHIEFIFPASISKINVKLTPEALEDFRLGNYHEWDNLNEEFDITAIDTSLIKLGWIALHYGRLLNPFVLCGHYNSLQGIIIAEANVRYGDGPGMYPWKHSGHMTYLFRNAFGDCPSGCIYNSFCYFRMPDGKIEYVGYWNKKGNPPQWWDEAKIAYEYYRYGRKPKTP